MTLRMRLTVWYAGVLMLTGGLLVTCVYLFAAHQMRREMEKFLEDEVLEWAEMCRRGLDDIPALKRTMESEVRHQRYFPMFCRLYDRLTGGDVVLVAPERWTKGFPAAVAFDEAGGRKAYSSLPVGADKQGLRVLTVPLGSDVRPGLILQGGVSFDRLNRRLGKLRQYSGAAFVVALLLALGGGWFLASGSLRPIDDIVSDLHKVESTNLSYRLIVPPARDEVARLRVAINRTLDRLEDSFGRIQGFTADAAHELRTPLSSLQCRLEVALNKARSPEEYHDALAEGLAETAALTRMVNNLLLLARMDSRAEPSGSDSIPLGEVLGELQDVFGVAATDKGVQLSVECDAECYVRAQMGHLRRLFGNLIDNAIRWSAAGGAVTLRSFPEGDDCVVQVSDTGTGIPLRLQQNVFERFFRVDDSRSRESGCAGLGLNICRGIVELYGGTIAVSSAPGKGSTFEVRLPSEDSPGQLSET